MGYNIFRNAFNKKAGNWFKRALKNVGKQIVKLESKIESGVKTVYGDVKGLAYKVEDDTVGILKSPLLWGVGIIGGVILLGTLQKRR